MNILGLKPGHDGTIVGLSDNRLSFSLEAEKDSCARYSVLTPSVLVDAFDLMDSAPDVIAINGYVKGSGLDSAPVGAGYLGVECSTMQERDQSFLGHPTKVFSSTHERSHILCAYGLSPFAQGRPCYALVWEGIIGSFYSISENLTISRKGPVLANPGSIYSLLYAIADPTAPIQKGYMRFSNPGKLMALAAYSDRSPMTEDENRFFDRLVAYGSATVDVNKIDFRDCPYYDIGIEHPAFTNFAGKASDALFEIFRRFAEANCEPGRPLLISGGCGLNCEWNTKWLQSGLFGDVFVPPVANDSGAALGTAIDAQHYYTGNAKIDWTVYAGLPFNHDQTDLSGFVQTTLKLGEVAELLARDGVIAWVQGNYEMGPRALGNRSILAAPFKRSMTERLNRIKQREGFRPVAPICLSEDVAQYFNWSRESPYMLYFQKVVSDRLGAVTHVDGTARVQTVSSDQNSRLHALLSAFKERTGHGVLCNTSLNFNGTGFINRLSDLVQFARETDLDGFVVGNHFYKKTSPP